MSDQTRAVREHWDRQAVKDIDPELVTHVDRYQRQVEIELLLRAIPHGQRVLDVGCGNGYTTAMLADRSAEVIGVDYSEPMLERARQEFGGPDNLQYRQLDVLELPSIGRTFDVVVTQRCLINLTSWEDQQTALNNIAEVLEPGGFYFMQEGTRQGRHGLDQARESVGLERMPPVAYNLDFDEELLWTFLRERFHVVSVRRLGAYDLISRVVHPLLVAPADPGYEAEINRIACRVATELDLCPQLAREFSATLQRR